MSLPTRSKSGDALAEMGKDEKYAQNSRDALKSAAGKYLGKEEMLVHFPPDYKIYEPRAEPYVFNLKAGETTDHWIMFPEGRNNEYTFKSDGLKFVVIYDDNEKLEAWNAKKIPYKIRAKFKFSAVNNQEIKLFVK